MEEKDGNLVEYWQSSSSLITNDMRIIHLLEEMNNKTIINNLEFIRNGANGLKDLYNDLESLGIKIKSKNYLDQVFILLTIDQASLDQMKK